MLAKASDWDMKIDWGAFGLNVNEQKGPELIERPVPDVSYCNPIKRTVTVIWKDGTSTTVHCMDMDKVLDEAGEVDLEKFKENGFRAALARKVYGHYKSYSRYIKRMIVQTSKPKKAKKDVLKISDSKGVVVEYPAESTKSKVK